MRTIIGACAGPFTSAMPFETLEIDATMTGTASFSAPSRTGSASIGGSGTVVLNRIRPKLPLGDVGQPAAGEFIVSQTPCCCTAQWDIEGFIELDIVVTGTSSVSLDPVGNGGTFTANYPLLVAFNPNIIGVSGGSKRPCRRNSTGVRLPATATPVVTQARCGITPGWPDSAWPFVPNSGTSILSGHGTAADPANVSLVFPNTSFAFTDFEIPCDPLETIQAYSFRVLATGSNPAQSYPDPFYGTHNASVSYSVQIDGVFTLS